METKLINMTPHSVNVIDYTGEVIEILPDEWEARLVEREEDTGWYLNGFKVVRMNYGDIELIRKKEGKVVETRPFPPPRPGVSYIVSMPCGLLLKGSRGDVFGPNSGKTAVRENGHVKFVRSMIHY